MQFARELGIRGISSMRKEELIDILKEYGV